MGIIKGLLTGEYPGTGRMEALTDGVFAIVMTLLVLEIALPETMESSEMIGLGQRLMDTWPQFFAYIISFIVLGYYWHMHHYNFNLIERIDGTILWLNILFLLIVALIPFSTNILGEYENNQTAFIFYACHLLVLNLISFVFFNYIIRKKHLRDSNVNVIYRIRIMKMLLPNLGIITGIVISFFSVEWAGYFYFGFLVVIILESLPNTFKLSRALSYKEDKDKVEDAETQ
jgi:uncharacterized membrane protein